MLKRSPTFREQSFGVITSNEFKSKGLLDSHLAPSAVLASLALDLRVSAQLQTGNPGTGLDKPRRLAFLYSANQSTLHCEGSRQQMVRSHRLVVTCGPSLSTLGAGLHSGIMSLCGLSSQTGFGTM